MCHTSAVIRQHNSVHAQANDLLLRDPVMRAHMQRLSEYLLVDEYQDSNPVQVHALTIIHMRRSIWWLAARSCICTAAEQTLHVVPHSVSCAFHVEGVIACLTCHRCVAALMDALIARATISSWCKSCRGCTESVMHMSAHLGLRLADLCRGRSLAFCCEL